MGTYQQDDGQFLFTNCYLENLRIGNQDSRTANFTLVQTFTIIWLTRADFSGISQFKAGGLIKLFYLMIK